MGIFDFLKRKSGTATSSVISVGVAPAKEGLVEVEPIPGLRLPSICVPYMDEVVKTGLPKLDIIATPQLDLTLEQSKLAHYPCMPRNFDYPRDRAGNYLFPLAQINLSEIPALVPFPRSGYLQFYVAADDMFGLNHDQPQQQTDFRVLFFEEADVADYKTDFSFLNDTLKSEMVPVFQPHSLSLRAGTDYLGPMDSRTLAPGKHYLEQFVSHWPQQIDELNDFFFDHYDGRGHKMGGYAGFAQEDPRPVEGPLSDYMVLFQLDSDDHIMWGDAGIANFFIHPDDLARKDFSKVMYNWDCH